MIWRPLLPTDSARAKTAGMIGAVGCPMSVKLWSKSSACAAVPLASAACNAEVLKPWPMTLVSSLAFSWRAISAQIFASSSLLPASATPRQSRTAVFAVCTAPGGMFSYFSCVVNCASFAVTSIKPPTIFLVKTNDSLLAKLQHGSQSKKTFPHQSTEAVSIAAKDTRKDTL